MMIWIYLTTIFFLLLKIVSLSDYLCPTDITTYLLATSVTTNSPDNLPSHKDPHAGDIISHTAVHTMDLFTVTTDGQNCCLRYQNLGVFPQVSIMYRFDVFSWLCVTIIMVSNHVMYLLKLWENGSSICYLPGLDSVKATPQAHPSEGITTKPLSPPQSIKSTPTPTPPSLMPHSIYPRRPS